MSGPVCKSCSKPLVGDGKFRVVARLGKSGDTLASETVCTDCFAMFMLTKRTEAELDSFIEAVRRA